MKNIKDMLMGVVDVYGNKYSHPIETKRALNLLFTSHSFGAFFRKIRPDTNIKCISGKIQTYVFQNHTGGYTINFKYNKDSLFSQRKGGLIKLIHNSFFDLQTRYPDTFSVGSMEPVFSTQGQIYNHQFSVDVNIQDKKSNKMVEKPINISFVVKPSNSVPVDFDAIAELIKGRRRELKQKLDEARVLWDDAITNYDAATKELNDFNRKFDSY